MPPADAPRPTAATSGTTQPYTPADLDALTAHARSAGRAWASALADALDQTRADVAAARQEADALRARLAAAEADTARLDWMEGAHATVDHGYTPSGWPTAPDAHRVLVGGRYSPGEVTADTVRAALDAARAAGERGP